MPCHRFEVPFLGFMCEPDPGPCDVCFKREATRLCDAGIGCSQCDRPGCTTCDRQLCDECTRAIGEHDLCPDHVEEMALRGLAALLRERRHP